MNKNHLKLSSYHEKNKNISLSQTNRYIDKKGLYHLKNNLLEKNTNNNISIPFSQSYRILNYIEKCNNKKTDENKKKKLSKKIKRKYRDNPFKSIPLNLKKSLLNNNYENKSILNDYKNISLIKRFESSSKSKNDIKLSEMNIQFYEIQKWWKNMFLIIKIQKYLRGFLFRKKFIEKLQYDFLIINLLVKIDLIYKKLWLKKVYYKLKYYSKFNRFLCLLKKIGDKTIIKSSLKKWNNNIILSKKLFQNIIFIELIRKIAKLINKQDFIFQLINIFKTIYEMNNLFTQTISKSGTVFTITNAKDNINSSNLSIQYISEKNYNSQNSNYDQDKSLVSCNFSISNIFFDNINNYTETYNSNNLSLTPNTINSFKLTERVTLNNKSFKNDLPENTNSYKEILVNYFKLWYNNINIDQNRKQKIQSIIKSVTIQKYFENYKINKSKKEFKEIIFKLKKKILKEKLNKYFEIWIQVSNKNKRIYNKLISKFKKKKIKKIIIQPRIIKNNHNNLNKELKNNYLLFKKELLFNVLMKWKIKNNYHKTLLSLYKKSIIKSLIKLKINTLNNNFYLKNNSIIIKNRINYLNRLFDVYKISNKRLFFKKWFNYINPLKKMKNENMEDKYNQSNSQIIKNKIKYNSDSRKGEKDRNKEDHKKSKKTLVFRFKKKNQINSSFYALETPENNNEQTNFINENYEMMKNKMEKKKSYQNIYLTTPQKKYKNMKKKKDLYMKNLDNSSIIDKETFSIFKTPTVFVKTLNNSNKKEKNNYYGNKYSKTEENVKSKNKIKLSDSLNFRDNKNLLINKKNIIKEISTSPTFRENKKIDFELKNENIINKNLFEQFQSMNSLTQQNQENSEKDDSVKSKRKNTDDLIENLTMMNNNNYYHNTDYNNHNYNNTTNYYINKGNKKVINDLSHRNINFNDKINKLKSVFQKLLLINRKFMLKQIIDTWRTINGYSSFEISDRSKQSSSLSYIKIDSSSILNVIGDNLGMNKINDEKKKVSVIKKISNINTLSKRSFSISPLKIKDCMKKNQSKYHINLNYLSNSENNNIVKTENTERVSLKKHNTNQNIFDKNNSSMKYSNNSSMNFKDEKEIIKFNEEVYNISNYHPPQKIKEIVIENLNFNKQILKEKEEQRENEFNFENNEKIMRSNRSFGSINQDQNYNINNYFFDNNQIYNNNTFGNCNSTEMQNQKDLNNKKQNYQISDFNIFSPKKNLSSNNLFQYKPPHVSGMTFTKKIIRNSDKHLTYSNSNSNLINTNNQNKNNQIYLQSNMEKCNKNQNNFQNKIYMKRINNISHPKNINKSYHQPLTMNTLFNENNNKYPYTINNNIITNNITFSNPYNFFNKYEKNEQEHLPTVQSETISSSFNNSLNGIPLIENHQEKLNSIKYSNESYIVSKDSKNMRMKGNFEEFINNNSNNIFYKNQKSQIQNSEYPIKKNDEIKEEEISINKIIQKNDEKIDNIIYSSKNNNNNQSIVKRYKHKKPFSISFPIKLNTPTKSSSYNNVGDKTKNDSHKFEFINEGENLMNCQSAKNINFNRVFSPNLLKKNNVEHKSLKITYKLKDINTNQLPPNSKRDDGNKVNQEKLYVYSIVKKTLNREKSSNYFSKKNFPNNNTFSKSPRLESKTKENLNNIEE